MTPPAQSTTVYGPGQEPSPKKQPGEHQPSPKKAAGRAPEQSRTRRVGMAGGEAAGHLVLELLESLDELPRVVAGDRQVQELHAALQVAHLAREDRLEGFPVDRGWIRPAPGAPLTSAADASRVQRQAGWAVFMPVNGQPTAHAMRPLGRGVRRALRVGCWAVSAGLRRTASAYLPSRIAFARSATAEWSMLSTDHCSSLVVGSVIPSAPLPSPRTIGACSCSSTMSSSTSCVLATTTSARKSAMRPCHLIFLPVPA